MNSPDKGSDIWLVVHIPKTAGTSFRRALEKRFGKRRVIRDYGLEAPETSRLVLDHVYDATRAVDGRENLIRTMQSGPGKVLVGHFPLAKYADYFAPERIIAFVRDPLVRVCSEYLHRIKNGKFEGSLLQFIGDPRFQNNQAKMLRGVSRHSFIGVTESYNESLLRINAANDWNLPELKRNVGRRGGGKKLAESLSTRELDFFYEVNQEDVELYQATRHRFDATETPCRKTGLLDLLG